MYIYVCVHFLQCRHFLQVKHDFRICTCMYVHGHKILPTLEHLHLNYC